jgi:hypothetical protein
MIFTTSTGKEHSREECLWAHAWQRFKQSKGVKLNGILECKPLSENAHRTDSCNPMMLTLTQQNPWLKTRTVPNLALCSVECKGRNQLLLPWSHHHIRLSCCVTSSVR